MPLLNGKRKHSNGLILNFEGDIPETSAIKILKRCLTEEQDEDENLSIEKQLSLRKLVQMPFSSVLMTNELKSLNSKEALAFLRILLNFLAKTSLSSDKDEESINYCRLIDIVKMFVDAQSSNFINNKDFREEISFLDSLNSYSISLTDMFIKLKTTEKCEKTNLTRSNCDYVIETLIF